MKIDKVTTICPWCKGPVISYWTSQGFLSRPSITLVADVVFHSDCWDLLVIKHPPNAVGTLDTIFASDPPIHDRWLECAFLLSPDGLALEFGTFRGKTLRRLCRVNARRIVYGFDSYEGLPEDWKPGFPKGALKTEPPEAWRIPENGRLIEGDIRNTLPGFLDTHFTREQQVAFVHFDMDVYVSTKAALDMLRDRLAPGCVFLFDEIYDKEGETHHAQHEGRAFREFIASTGCRVELLGRRRHEAWAFRVYNI